VCITFYNGAFGMESKNKSQPNLTTLEKKLNAVAANLASQKKQSLRKILNALYADQLDVGDAADKKMIQDAFLAEKKKLDEAFAKTGLAKQFFSPLHDDNESQCETMVIKQNTLLHDDNESQCETMAIKQNTLRQRYVTNSDQVQD